MQKATLLYTVFGAKFFALDLETNEAFGFRTYDEAMHFVVNMWKRGKKATLKRAA